MTNTSSQTHTRALSLSLRLDNKGARTKRSGDLVQQNSALAHALSSSLLLSANHSLKRGVIAELEDVIPPHELREREREHVTGKRTRARLLRQQFDLGAAPAETCTEVP